MWPRSSLCAVERRRCRSRFVIPPITKTRLHLLMPQPRSCRATVFIYVKSSKSCCMCGMSERNSYISPRAFLCRVYVFSLCSRWDSPASCIGVGQIDLRCEYLCESLLLYVSPAISWWLQGRRWTGGVQHYIIKQGFTHYEHGCLFRKLLWPILSCSFIVCHQPPYSWMGLGQQFLQIPYSSFSLFVVTGFFLDRFAEASMNLLPLQVFVPWGKKHSVNKTHAVPLLQGSNIQHIITLFKNLLICSSNQLRLVGRLGYIYSTWGLSLQFKFILD